MDGNQAKKLYLSLDRDLLEGRDDLNLVAQFRNQHTKEADLSKFKLKVVVEEPDNLLIQRC